MASENPSYVLNPSGNLRGPGESLMRILSRILSGRVAIDPISIQNRSAFVEYLERNATRIESAWKLEIPLFSSKKGYVFFEDEKRILIRYNSERGFFNFTRERFTSTCFFSGKIENDGTGNVLRGSYRFPAFMEFPRYVILTGAVYLVFYFGYLVVSGSVTWVDSIIFVGGLLFFYAGAKLYGNVSAPISILARITMKKVDALLAEYADRQ